MPIDVQIIPELKDALGAGFENIIYELNGHNPVGGSTQPSKKSPQRKRKVKGGENESKEIQGGSRKKSKSKKRSSPKRKSIKRKSKSPSRKLASHKLHPVKVGPRTPMGYFIERNKQVLLGPYPTKQAATKAKSRLGAMLHTL